MFGAAMIGLVLTLLAVANPYFDEAKRLADDLHFAEAIEQLKVARQVPGRTEAEQVEVLDLLARCLAAEGRRSEAQSTYEELLVIAPSFEPDRSLSPKILEAFDAAKAKVFPPGYLELQPLPAPFGRARLRVIDPWQRAISFELNMRVDTEETWTTTPLTSEEGALTIELMGAPLRTLEWFVNALDASGAVVGRYGSAQEPKRHTIPAVTPGALVVTDTPRVQRWPAWVAVGIGVAAAITGVAFQVQSAQRARLLDDRTMAPGDWADTARAEHSRAQRDATIATVLFVAGGAAAGVATLVFAW
jgi:hypothetical protein